MANISHITLRRYGATDSPYDPEAANAPLDDLYTIAKLINEESEATANEVHEARGVAPTLKDRLDAALKPDGTIKSDAVSEISIGSIVPENNGTNADKVMITRGELDKLKGVSSKANFMTLRIGDGSEMSGIVKLVAGSTIKLSPVTSGDGSTTIKIDTIFTGDRIHEHRSYQDCAVYSQGIAYIPNLDDDPIPGTVEVYLNGQLLRRSSFEEHVSQENGRIDGVRIKENPDAIQLSSDNVWFSYRVRPASSSRGRSIDDQIRHMVFNHDVASSDFRNVYLPLGSTVANLYRFWLIKLPEGVKPPYDTMMLFVSEDAFPHSAGVRGMTARRYGQDWDVVNLNGLSYLRWRHDEIHPVDGPTSYDDSYSYLTEMGSGTPVEPSLGYAPAPLATGMRLMLVY